MIPRTVIALALALLIPLSCGQGATVRQRILASNSRLIGDSYSSEGPGSMWPTVHVALLPGTTLEQADQFWCDVVVPAGGTHDASGVVVTISIQGGPVFGDVATDATCPTAP